MPDEEALKDAIDTLLDLVVYVDQMRPELQRLGLPGAQSAIDTIRAKVVASLSAMTKTEGARQPN